MTLAGVGIASSNRRMRPPIMCLAGTCFQRTFRSARKVALYA